MIWLPCVFTTSVPSPVSTAESWVWALVLALTHSFWNWELWTTFSTVLFTKSWTALLTGPAMALAMTSAFGRPLAAANSLIRFGMSIFSMTAVLTLAAIALWTAGSDARGVTVATYSSVLMISSRA